jgi:hypothetical protein
VRRALDETCRDWQYERASVGPVHRVWIDARYVVAVSGLLLRIAAGELSNSAAWASLGRTLALGLLGSLVLLGPAAFQSKPLYVETMAWAGMHLMLVPSMLVLSLPLACAVMSAASPDRMRRFGTVALVTLLALAVTGWWAPLANRAYRYERLRAANEVGPGASGAVREAGLAELDIQGLMRLARHSDLRARQARFAAIKRASVTLIAPVAIGIGLTMRRLGRTRGYARLAPVFSMLAVVAAFAAPSITPRAPWFSWNPGTSPDPLAETVLAASALLVALLELMVLSVSASRIGPRRARA